jgi:2-polyprenyl-3-methyl-5-hydroxy-6-metoxy-1,4-benzoquinol methylase
LSADSHEKIKDYKDLISKISSRFLRYKPMIVDIGGNDGSLMQIAKKKNFLEMNIEPTNVANISKERGIKTLKKKFNSTTANNLKKKKLLFDFVISTNFFAHTNNLNEIIVGVKKILKNDGILIIEAQYIYKVLKANGFDSFHQDHKYYYSINSISKILKIFDLHVFDVEFLKYQPEIIRIFASKKIRKKTIRYNKILKTENDKEIVKKIKKLNTFRVKYIVKIKNLIKKLNHQKKNIYGISASPRGCVLLNSGNFNRKNIKIIGEMSKSFKLKKLIPGTNILIKDENSILIDQPDFVLILAWHLKHRLMKSLRKRGYKGKFIIPLPKIKIL